MHVLQNANVFAVGQNVIATKSVCRPLDLVSDLTPPAVALTLATLIALFQSENLNTADFDDA